MNIFALVYWTAVLALTALGDLIVPRFGSHFGQFDEKLSYTHYLAVHIPVGLRAALLGWLVYHFLVQHVYG